MNITLAFLSFYSPLVTCGPQLKQYHLILPVASDSRLHGYTQPCIATWRRDLRSRTTRLICPALCQPKQRSRMPRICENTVSKVAESLLSEITTSSNTDPMLIFWKATICSLSGIAPTFGSLESTPCMLTKRRATTILLWNASAARACNHSGRSCKR